jgi:hypothetical protein
MGGCLAAYGRGFEVAEKVSGSGGGDGGGGFGTVVASLRMGARWSMLRM